MRRIALLCLALAACAHAPRVTVGGDAPLWEAVLTELHGGPRAALAGWAAVLAHTTDDAVARVALSRLDAIVTAGVDDPAALRGLVAPPKRRAQLARLRAHVARLDGDASAVLAYDAEAGCAVTWRAGAPLGALPRLALARPVPEHSRDIDGRRVQQRGCRVLVLTPDGRPGAVPVETVLSVERKSTWRLTVDTDQPYRVWVDGQGTPMPDGSAPLVRTRVVRIALSRGRHRLAVAIAAPLGRVELGLSLERAESHELPGTLAFEVTAAGRRDLQGTWVEAADSLARGDVVASRAAAERLVELGPRSAAALALAADVAAQDPTVPVRVANDRARRLREQALALDPGAAGVREALGRLALDRDRVKDALELAQGAGVGDARIAALAAEALNARDRGAEVRAVLLAARDEGECALAQAWLSDDLARHQPVDLGRAARVARCGGSALADALRRTGRADDAIAAYRATIVRDPLSESPRASLADSLVERGRLEEAVEVLRELVDAAPRSTTYRLRLVDALVAAHRGVEADRALQEGLALDPESAELELACRERSGDHGPPYGADRIDGRRVIAEFEAAHATYDGPAVFVLDRAVRRVFATGGQRTITHNIVKVLTKEGIDRWGEWTLPLGAELLSLAAWKADGSRLEPELMAEKESISLPGLAVGDYVELEYVERAGPSAAFRGGFLGERFFFASFDAPLDRSEYVVVTPHDLPLTLDARNGPPVATLVVRDEPGGRVDIRTFAGRHFPQQVAEPSSAPSAEYFASVRVSSGVTTTAWRDYLRDASWSTRRRDPAIDTLVRTLVEGAPSALDLLERVDRWVRRNVKQAGGLDDTPSAVLARREGNRATLVCALATAAGIPARLVVARSLRAASVDLDLEGFDQVLVEAAGTFDDPRTRHGRPGELLPQLRGAVALPLEGAENVVTLPTSTVDLRQLRVSMSLARDGSGDVRVEEKLVGWPATEWRESLSLLAPDRVRAQFEQHSLAAFFPGATLKELRWEHADESDVPFVVRYSLQAPGLAHPQGDALVLPVPFAGELLKRYATGARRQSPYLVEAVAHTTLELRVTPWAGARVQVAPGVTADGPVGRFAQDAAMERGVLVLRSRFDLPMQRVPADRAAALLGWGEAVDRAESAAARLSTR